MLSNFGHHAEGWYVRQKKERVWKHTLNYDFVKFCNWKGWQTKTAKEYENSHLPYPSKENSAEVFDPIF